MRFWNDERVLVSVPLLGIFANDKSGELWVGSNTFSVSPPFIGTFRLQEIGVKIGTPDRGEDD